jgi:hypothetical protein
MVMTASTLATELKKLGPTDTEPPVTEGWANAYTIYMGESAVLGTSPLVDPGSDPPTFSVMAAAKAAMKTALTGISTTKDPLPAAQLIVAAIKAFWTTLLPLGTTVWLTTPFPLVPAPFTPPLAFLSPDAELLVAQALAAVFTANTAGSLSKNASYDAIVAVLHPAGAGATVTQATTPSPTPGIPVL